MSACRIATAAASVFNFQAMQNCRTQNVNEAIRIVNHSLHTRRMNEKWEKSVRTVSQFAHVRKSQVKTAHSDVANATAR